MSCSYDVSFINPFLEAVSNVLTTMAQVPVTPARPYINKDRTAAGDVTGIIAIMGALTGVVSVTFEKDVILKIANNMLGESYTEIDANITDCVGELTNMITGQARMHLANLGMSLQSSTPVVASGKGLVIAHIASAPILSIPFGTEQGSFVVEVSMAAAKKAPANAQPQDFGVPVSRSLWRRPDSKK